MKPEETKIEEKEELNNSEDMSAENLNDAIEDKKKNEKKSKNSEKDKVQELGEKLAELNDKYLRLYSEFENYRKRTNQEKADLIKYGSEDTIKAILPIVDDYERALQAFGENDDNAALKEGVVLIYNKLMSTLQQKGLKAIEAKGEKFDENLHEAVAQFPASDEEQKGKVIDEVVKGYYLNDKVIRYSKVVVAI
ncbi:MAG: nucleotide exchange factor GrpE [Bacteroidales bacterium]|nr:nucleotide exchange factor GrpE [Bacteroidales bacterium]